MMKKNITSLLLMSLCFSSLIGASVEAESSIQTMVKLANYGHIDAKGLKALMDSKTPFVLLDARGNDWSDGNKIQGAILASYKNSPEELELIIPHTDTLVVVYCFSATCPLSPRLAQKLVDWGYANVVEFSGGLKEWRDVFGYPTEPIQDNT